MRLCESKSLVNPVGDGSPRSGSLTVAREFKAGEFGERASAGRARIGECCCAGACDLSSREAQPGQAVLRSMEH